MEKKPDEFKDIEYFREWSALAQKQLSNTRYFLIFVVIFFIGGIALLIYHPKNNISLTLYPHIETKKELIPSVMHRTSSVQLNENGAAELEVGSDDTISIQFDKIYSEINNLKSQLDQQRSAYKDVVLKLVPSSKNSGFDLK